MHIHIETEKEKERHRGKVRYRDGQTETEMMKHGERKRLDMFYRAIAANVALIKNTYF